ncbi:MAG: hypothetical protein IKE40_02860 [Firmicutes bacterium]|nr:hypothetical protein [Bacillota bacterium]
MALLRWRVVFYVNGVKSETVVSAPTSNDASKIVEAQYAGARKLYISFVERL